MARVSAILSGTGFLRDGVARFLGPSLGVCLLSCIFLTSRSISYAAENEPFRMPILAYHRFSRTVTDRMTVTLSVFESQLKYLRDHGYQTIPLKQFVEYRLTGAPLLPLRHVAITADDGHRSVYTSMLPLVRAYHLPVTLFVYPSAISNADYALTWEELLELKQTGLFDIQSHSYWHPNFKVEKRRLKQNAYEKLIEIQLKGSRERLETKLQAKVDMLAWPFGIFDDELIGRAAQAGYIAAFTLEGRAATQNDSVMALPRYLMAQAYEGKVFVDLLAGKRDRSVKSY